MACRKTNALGMGEAFGKPRHRITIGEEIPCALRSAPACSKLAITSGEKRSAGHATAGQGRPIPETAS